MRRAFIVFVAFLASGAALPADARTGIKPPLRPLDAFVAAGQSNATGMGEAALSPAVPVSVGLQFYLGSLTAARDPVGRAETGSAWPAFVNAYHRVTGHAVLVIPAASGGSSLTRIEANGWHPRGLLFGQAVALTEAALAALPERGYQPTLSGILWSQGETDAKFIARGEIHAEAYERALVRLIARFRARFGPELPFYIIRTGRRLDPRFETGMRAVRLAQERVANADPFTWIVYREAVFFPARGWMRDDVHYSQPGLNHAGTRAGVYVGCLVTLVAERCRP